MCGVAGTFNLDGRPASPTTVRNMSSELAHRGPDGAGVFVDGAVALGHRRLAIIDLSSAGQQPMATPDGRYALTYNGEVYNYRELRAQLRSLGHRIESETDSEVVLHAFVEWGPKCVERFNGMFAFAVWDAEQGSLFLARDRYGIKPLYYAFFGNTLLFASEQKALLAHPAASREVDLEGLFEYLTFQNLFTRRTLLAGIHLFPAGSWAVVRSGESKRELSLTRYWDFDFAEPEHAADRAEYVEELDRLFVQAVVRQLVGDVDIGSYLSGGMDSGSIAAVAATQLPLLRTFTVGFDVHSASGLELQCDERDSAEFMSYRFGTEHYEMVLKAGDMARAFPKLVWHLEEPRVGQSYPNFYAAQVASRFGKVVLAGTGGDELFCGYPWRYYRAMDNTSFEDYVDKYYDYWQRLTTKEEIRSVFSPVWSQVRQVETRTIFRDALHRQESALRPVDYINHSMYLEAKTFLHGLLVVEDKLSMAHSLETRVPFLDNDLVDFAMKVPVQLKLGELSAAQRINENEPGPKRAMLFRQAKYGKLLLRAAMERHIPAEILDREKQGFSAPDASWFRGESIEYVRDKLFSPRARIYEYLDRKAVTSLIDQHIGGTHNRRLLVWSLLYLENWFEQYLA